MNKKAFLKAYQDINRLAGRQNDDSTKKASPTSKIYRSAKDEELIKNYHYAKFQKNLHQAENDPELKALVEKEEWSDDDIQRLLSLMR